MKIPFFLRLLQCLGLVREIFAVVQTPSMGIHGDEIRVGKTAV